MRRLIAAAVVALALVAGAVVSGAPAQASSAAAVYPVVNGNRLVNSRTGQTFVPHGVNWPSFEYACQQGWGYDQGGDTLAAAQAMVSWHINTVRIPMNEGCWLGYGLGSADGTHLTEEGYRAELTNWVGILNSVGIVTILDLHYSAPDGEDAYGQYPMADEDHSPAFWASVATEFAGDRSMMFDAFNEPYSIWDDATNSLSYELTWNCWENGGPSCTAPDVGENQQPDGHGTYQIAGMQELVTAIRNAGAAQPIMLGGIDYSNDLTGWIAHEPDDSLHNLVVSWHNYPGQDCDTIGCWNSEIVPVATVVPVVAGEFGETDGGNTFMTRFMNWADTHGIGYLPWAWWDVPASEDKDAALYALYQGSNFTPKYPEGTAYHSHLLALPGASNGVAGIGSGSALTGNAPPVPPTQRRTDVPEPARQGPSEATADSTTAILTGAGDNLGTPASRELARLLADAPPTSATFCAYG
jgi:endoglucanase